jgi:hypothetical protein
MTSYLRRAALSAFVLAAAAPAVLAANAPQPVPAAGAPVQTMQDIWGDTAAVPGQDLSHGGSTTQSLGVGRPGTSIH